MKTLALVLLAAALHAQDYPLGPESQPQANGPKGTVTRGLRLEPGKFYPGTPHTYATYVPAQYDAAKPAPFMIFLDGSGAAGNGTRVPVVFDNLIAKGDLPPIIGIFIDPGVLPVLNDQAQNRFERIFEYDNLSDRFAHFLLEEVIPEVGKKYNLSKNPDGHALYGVSTGAVGAFMAAWNRPDQFHRVFSVIGTFVAMKGADTLPALIRKTEPKPIRIFMQEGRNDHIVPGQPYGTFYAGSWPINNQVMYEAFQFAGYDVKFVMGEGGHSGQQAASILPDAMRWLWRDYGKPITAHEPSAMGQPGWDARGQVAGVVSIDKPWELVGPAATNAATDKDGKVIFKDAASGLKVVRVAPNGRLYATQPARKRIVSYSAAGGDEKVVAQNVEAGDLAITATGAIYFTDPAKKTVSLINPAGQTRVVYNAGEIAQPSALSLTPDQAFLIVGDAQTRFSWSFQIAADGALIHGEPFFRLEMPELTPHSEVAGITVDNTGQVYFADAIGIQICEPNGRCAQILSKPEPGTLTSIAFGGKDASYLYVTVNGKLFRRPTKRTGVTAWAPVKPPRPAL